MAKKSKELEVPEVEQELNDPEEIIDENQVIEGEGEETQEEHKEVVKETVKVVKEERKAEPKVVDVTPVVKMVGIHTVEDVDCYIGGVHILLPKGKDAKVSSDVAAILNNAKLAYRN